MKIIFLALLMLAFIILYSCLMVAKTSDEDAERLYQDYLRYKREKEKENVQHGQH